MSTLCATRLDCNLRLIALVIPGLLGGCGTGPEGAPERLPDTPLTRGLESALRPVLFDAIEARVSPGIAIEVGNRDGALVRMTLGRLSYDAGAEPVGAETRYDVASLTKVVATTTLFAKMQARSQIALDEKVARWIPEFEAGARAGVTFWHLLTHTSGLPAWRKLFETCRGRDEFLSAIAAEKLEAAPGEVYRYSDLGMILVGLALERCSGKTLDQLFAQRMAEPLGLTATGFRPSEKNICAPTEQCDVRERMVQGEVHDENAWAIGGVAGHAGLFSTVSDLGRVCRYWLRAEGIERETLQAFTRRVYSPRGSTRAIGWDTAHRRASCGPSWPEEAFGHTGFTGTSLWCDRDASLYVVLLTNRVHPTRKNKKHVALRRKVHEVVRRFITDFDRGASGP